MTENNTPFIEDNDQTRARREHLERIRQLTGNAYPNKFRRTNLTGSAEGEDTITSVVRKFKRHEPPRAAAGEKPSPEGIEAANAELRAYGDVRLGGRLAVPPRVMGKAAFVHLSDGRERLQIYVRRDDVRPMRHGGRELDGWELFSLLDHGDFIGVEGFLFITKTGELSVHVRAFEFLTKALLPMPDKMHGITDPEIGRRYRYADLIAGSLKIERDEADAADHARRELTPREVFERRSRIIREMRTFLDERGYVEVETPMLSPIASGAAARPFKTHHNALGIDLYARIAPELYLKRLLVGGFERVYELNRNFRNEGIDRTHNPEFTMLEFYCAYMDVNGMMDFCEEMIRQSVVAATGDTTVHFEGQEFEFSHFKRMTMKEAIREYLSPKYEAIVKEPFDIGFLNSPERVRGIASEAARLGYLELQDIERLLNDKSLTLTLSYGGEITYNHIEVIRHYLRGEGNVDLAELSYQAEETQTAHLIQHIFESLAERHLLSPTFITDFPKAVSPLSKASPDDPSVAERFELFINGMECANGFSELNDPLEQYERFREQVGARERGDEEAMQMDTDYVRALAYGMPPAAGIGIGIDRIVMLLTGRRSIRDVILFPHMRPLASKQEEAADESAESNGEQAGAQA